MRAIDMAKKSDGGKGSRSAKTGQSATASNAKQDEYLEKMASVIPRMRYNARTGTLIVGSYRRDNLNMNVTKR